MYVQLDRVSRAGITLHTVFESKTRPSALKKLSHFYVGQYVHDLDTDRSQIPESMFRITVCHSNGKNRSIMTFSDRQLVDSNAVYHAIVSMIKM